MSGLPSREQELEDRIRRLEAENRCLRRGVFDDRSASAVDVPPSLEAIFRGAEERVGAYFREFHADPGRGTIEIAGERYVLLRAASLSYGFVKAIRVLYAERGDEAATRIGKTLLFDMAHVLGAADARNFHHKMGVTDPLTRLSTGPVHFAFTGWASVEVLPESHPSPDDDYCIVYNHPNSFESHSWLMAGKKTDFPVCVMSAGYSSGWCEESYGLPLTATEIACKAKGDETCTFIMAPPHRIQEYVETALASSDASDRERAVLEIPMLFERKEAEERLHVALRDAHRATLAKGRFLANMSHEIRTPLTAILGTASLLQRQDLEPQHRRYVDTIDQSGKVLLAILNDILDLSKIEAGKMALTFEPCDVRALLREVVAGLQARAEEHHLAFRADVDPSVPRYVLTDALRLRQIVLNLASNALKFTDEGHVVVRGAWTASTGLLIEVEDTGIGIAPSDIEELFEDFTQAEHPGGRSFGGTGLGLGIARKLVRLFGGTIGATSVPGKGSTFRFEIPAEPSEGPRPSKVERPIRDFGGRVRMLVVDDDRFARFVVEQLLLHYGCRVDTVGNGAEAVESVLKGAYDLVFMDCRMPVMDGFEATRKIRKEGGALATLPIIGMSASVMESDSALCLDVGMSAFLAKPVDPEALERLLAEVLEHDQ